MLFEGGDVKFRIFFCFVFSPLLPQEAPRVMASIREQSKAGSDKQRLGEDALFKQEKRKVKKNVVLIMGGNKIPCTSYLPRVLLFLRSVIEFKENIHKYVSSTTCPSSWNACEYGTHVS